MVLQIVQVVKHLRIQFLQERFVSIIAIKDIRNHDNGTAPAAGTSAGRNVWCRILDMAGDGILAVCDILDPLPVKLLAVQLDHGRITGELPVSRIASSLYMRTVGRDSAMHVVQLCPKICLPEPV